MVKRTLYFFSLFAAAVFCLAPVLFQLAASFTPEERLTELTAGFPDPLMWSHYRTVLQQTEFPKALRNSLLVAAITTAAALLLAAPAAYALAKLPVRGKGSILAFVLSTSMLPQIALASPLYLVIRALHLRDTLWALALVYTTFAVPLAIWLLYSFLVRLPDELLAAARIDGAGELRCFCLIALPLLRPGIAAAAILIFLFSWNEFLFALTLSATSASRTVPVEIALFPGLHTIPWGEISAASILAVLPAAALVLLFQRRITAGLTAGAIKG